MNDDIEILDDFSDGQNQGNNSVMPNNNQSFGATPTQNADNAYQPNVGPSAPSSSPKSLWDVEMPTAAPIQQPAGTPQAPIPAFEPVTPQTPIPAFEPVTPQTPIPAFEPVAPQAPSSTPEVQASVPTYESVSEFDKMVSEASNIDSNPGVNDSLLYQPPTKQPDVPVAPNNQSYDNGFNSNEYAGDANNDLVQSNNQDLTITAVYPNGLAVDKNEEMENTQVIKPKKKSSSDLPLIIIVAVLAITFVVLLIVLYL